MSFEAILWAVSSSKLSLCMNLVFLMFGFQMFGQVPVFKDGDFELAQSNAILRYVARKLGVNTT